MVAFFLCLWVTAVALARGARAFASDVFRLAGAFAGAAAAPSVETGSCSAILFLGMQLTSCGSPV
jgi:hypothetical protein